jgi:drug/metabolite transporter (DMT)-like permease
MPIWILLAIAAQFLNAIVSLVDKYIVSSKHILPQPFVYAFYICILSGGAIVVYALGAVPVPIEGISFPSLRNVHFPTLEIMALSILAAYTFFYALVSMFKALQQSDASDVVPVVGAVTAICSFGLAYLFLDATLSPNFLLGVMLLVFGTLLVSHFRFSWRGALSSLYAGIFFALYYVVIKGLFIVTSFDNGFFWSRAGLVVFALSLLLVPRYGTKIWSHTKSTGKRASRLILMNKVIAGFASILILKATELGDVSVVQALGGLQYIFIFILAVVVAPYTAASACGEGGCTPKVLIHKALFVAIITLGFFVLFR